MRKRVRPHATCDHAHRKAWANRLSSGDNAETSFPQNGRLMLGHEGRSKLLAKLTNARCELEDALNHSIPTARYDPVVIPEPTRNRLSGMIDDINAVLRQMKGSKWCGNVLAYREW